ncbi:MAG: U32 family peptidase, partial [Firmicutes bacterium]|nr:U32 family peptidase [Bacillota bacterium]
MSNAIRKIPELLAPAGNLEILKLAVDAGADAVYFGGKVFNARQSAANFDAAEIREAVEYCYPRGAKTYLTLNTLVKESEWDELCRFVDEVLPLGITGLIMQDMGAAQYVKQRFPEVELHGSTQMSIHNAEGAAWLKELGFSRVVLSRELPLSEVANIVKNVGVETEIFIHGALCYSYSGQCLLSSLIGGRSGNRGRCAQPCRLQYSLSDDPAKRHYLNLKDICTLSEVKALAESGAASLKIEGRLKGAPYVAGVTKAYRRALDYYQATGSNYEPSKEEMEELMLLFNRGGFSKGYTLGKTQDMICQESPKHSGIHAGKVQELSPKQMLLSLNTKVEP